MHGSDYEVLLKFVSSCLDQTVNVDYNRFCYTSKINKYYTKEMQEVVDDSKLLKLDFDTAQYSAIDLGH